jgi:hypothetical protein
MVTGTTVVLSESVFCISSLSATEWSTSTLGTELVLGDEASLVRGGVGAEDSGGGVVD